MCCDKRHTAFTKVAVGVWLVRWLTRCASHHAYLVHAYCVMPDHVHLLTEGTRETCHLAEFISEFKQRTGYLYQKKLGTCLWQPRYYDHVLHRSEDIENVAWYIWTNPVRKGLCSSPQEYLLSGSLTSDWKKRCAQPGCGLRLGRVTASGNPLAPQLLRVNLRNCQYAGFICI